MTAITPNHEDLLAALSTSDLLAPITGENAADPTPLPVPAAVLALQPKAMPSLAELDAAAAAIMLTEDTSSIVRLEWPIGIPASEDVSHKLRHHGTQLRSGLEALLSEKVQSAGDVLYLQRLISSVAVQALGTFQFGVLLEREAEAKKVKTSGLGEGVRAALEGTVAAVEAGAHLTPEELAYVVEHVAAGRLNIAQNLAGPLVDVQAMAKGQGKDWRALANDWAEKAEVLENITFTAGNEAGTSPGQHIKVSWSITVRPGAGWVLSRFFDGVWFPVQASAEALDYARALRADVQAQRSRAAKHTPSMHTSVFADDLAYS